MSGGFASVATPRRDDLEALTLEERGHDAVVEHLEHQFSTRTAIGGDDEVWNRKIEVDESKCERARRVRGARRTRESPSSAGVTGFVR